MRFLTLFALFLTAPAFAQAPDARTAWGFERSDLTPDPRIRFGVLANGMRYAILPNRGPRGAVAVRLLVRAGAVNGAPGEAHGLEHLAFQSSRRAPEGAAARLRHWGLRLGRDYNGHTGYRDTIYRIDLPANRLDAALLILRDVASDVTLTPEAVERARPALLEEARQRSGPADRADRDQIAFFAPGTSIARRWLTGSESEVAAVGADGLAHFYARYYSPERTTLIIVGDVDPATAEARIRAQFESWRARDPVPGPPRERIAPANADRFRLFSAPGTPTWASVAAILPDEAADNAAPRDQGFLASLAADMLAARVTGYRGDDRPFMDAEALVQDYYGLGRIASFRVRAIDRDWRLALEVAGRELRRALAEGFEQAELDAALAREGERLAELAGPQTSAALADRIAAMAGAGIVPTAPGNEADTAAYLARIRLDQVNAAFRAAWAAPGRLVHVAHDRPIEGDEAAIAEIWRAQ